MPKKKKTKKIEKKVEGALMLKETNTEIQGSVFDTRIFNKIEKFANIVSKSKLVPVHLQGKPEDCFLVTSQAFKWGMDPFTVAQGSAVVKGKLCYEGKLVAAVVEKLAGVVLSYEYSGEGSNRQVIVSGQRRTDKEPQSITIIFKDVVTDNAHWKKDPDQMLAYRGSRGWARRYTPGALQGVYTKDEILDSPDIKSDTPIVDAVAERMNKEASQEPTVHATIYEGEFEIQPNVEPEAEEFKFENFRFLLDQKKGTTIYSTFEEIYKKMKEFLLRENSKERREKIKLDNIEAFRAMEAYNPDLTTELNDIIKEAI